MSKYFEDHVEEGRRGAAFLARHPIRAVIALLDLYSQPQLVARPTNDLQAGPYARASTIRPGWPEP